MEATVRNVEDSVDTDDARCVTTFTFAETNFVQLDNEGVSSPPCVIHNIPWKICIKKTSNSSLNPYPIGLGLSLMCVVDPKNTSWRCHATFKLSVVFYSYNNAPAGHDISQEFQHTFTSTNCCMGNDNFMDWNDVINPANHFISNFGTVIFRAEVNANSPLGIPSDCENLASHLSLKNHGAFSAYKSLSQNLSTESKIDLKIWTPLAHVNQYTLDKVRLAYVFGRFGNEALIITDDDEVRACTNGKSSGFFSRNTSSQYATHAKMDMVDVLNKQDIKGLSFGLRGCGDPTFMVVCTLSGNVIQLKWPLGGKGDDIIPISELGCLPQISEVACGSQHCLALSTTGQVFSWGSNKYGQIGSGDISVKCYEIPYEIKNGLKNKYVVKISCGLNFSVVVLDDGRVYTWGKGVYEGEIDQCQFLPVPVPLDDVIIQEIVCGSSYVLAISSHCELFVWGMNNRGQLGLGDTEFRSFPTINRAVKKVVDIAASCYSHTSAAMTADYEVYMWGYCSDNIIIKPMKTPHKSPMEVFAYYGFPRVTYKPIICQSQSKSVSESIRRSFNDETTSDLIIKADDKEIFVHRSILKVRSGYFRLFLQDHWTNESQKTMEVKLPYNVIYSYLQYLYTGDFEADEELTQELLILADEYQDLPFKELCEERIKRQIRIDNVGLLFPLALKLNAKRVRDSCISFASNCISEVVETLAFQSWDKDALMEFIAECNKRKLFKT